MKPQLTLIAAMDLNRLLANEHGIPWHQPRDVAHFREHTRDKWLLLGRRTYEEMRGWFRAGHIPLVLTNRRDYAPQIGHAVSSVAQALTLVEQAGQRELVCCGGAQTYAAALPLADRLVLTQVQAFFPLRKSPVYFPAWSPHDWSISVESSSQPDAENAFAMRMLHLARKHR